MRSQRFLELTLAAIVALALGAAVDCAFAQSSPRQIVPQKKSEARRPARPSKVDHAARLDALYEALKRAPTATVAKVIENRIDAIMLRSGSDTADLLMTRARAVMEQKEYDLSISLLDTVIELKPDFTEAFAQRATVHYLKKNIARSLADLRVVIAREPRHYASLAGLGVILQDIGEDRRALEAFRRAIAINPHIQAIPELIKRLEVKVEGREI
jgi:tetratricopeptide (TPR) repeat protein